MIRNHNVTGGHMIERNIVRIETLDGMGTGLIYPCCHGNRKGYIIFTNEHVLESVSELENIQEQIQIVIYDDFGKEISDAKMKNWDCYWNKSSLEYQDDIAAIYLELDDDVVFHLETAVELDELDNRTSVFMEGYPGIMSNDDINRRIQLEGVSKSLFPSNKEIGVYQITDDYHWYSNYSDYKVLAGISGSPVYHKRRGRNYILGINQSVSNVDQGENPFKLVYYIKFKHILDYLRQKDCIIFSMISECEFQIFWTKDKKQRMLNEIKLLLIGGSGSGKSSFVKSFAYHQRRIRGVGDGQTTRSDVSYSFSRVMKEPNVKVIFLSKDEFVDSINDHIGTIPIRLTFAQALGISTKAVEDEEKFLILLHGIYEQFVRLEEEKNAGIENNKERGKDCQKVFGYIRELLFYGETVRNKTVKYENILDHFLELIPYYFMPCILDESWRYKHAVGGVLSDEKVLKFFGIFKPQNSKDGRVWTILATKVYEIIWKNEKKHFDTLQKDLVPIFYALYQLRYENERYLEKKASDLYSKLKEFTMKEIPQIIHADSHKEFENKLKDFGFQKRLFDSIVHVTGFFDAKEFEFLLEKDWIKGVQVECSLIEFRKSNDESDDEWDKTLEQEGNKENIKKRKDIVISTGISAILGRIYQMIMEAIKRHPNYYDRTKCNGTKGDKTYKDEFFFKLDNMNETDILTLQKCLKVTKEGSFTGVIQSVMIQDKVSDLYAVILEKLEIDTLTIVDTCGLDHVTIWNQKDLKKQVERLYTDYVKKWEMTKEKQQNRMMETGILYIKKLDSGKPDELNSILPIVREIIPSTPMYCMFSGIDIFYRTEQEIDNIFWRKNSTNCPKAVRYLLENDMGMQDIVDVNAYKVLKNNLIPFCGDEKLVNAKFAYYRNNVGAVRNLLTSIAMKESSSLEIIDQSFVDGIAKGEYDEKIGEILNTMFETASLHSRYVWWNTQKADIKSFFRDGVMGYWRTYNHMLYYLFHVGYVTAVREKGNMLFEKTNGKEVKYRAAVIASLYNMENLFLGINDNLIETKLDNKEKNEFRLIIEDMYKQSKYNPFSEAYEEYLTDEYIRGHRAEIFDEIFGLAKYIDAKEKGDKILQRLIEFFKEQFLKQMEMDNNRKATYLVKMNEAFVEELDNVKKEFCEKYGDKDYEGEKMFETFMRYYFSSSSNNGDK